VGQLRLERELAPRRELLRAALAGAGFAAALVAFELAISTAFAVPEGHAARKGLSGEYVERGLSLFEFYRRTLGWSEYREMLPSLAPQLAALVALAAATPQALRTKGRAADSALLAWAVALLGLGVGLFHAAAFRYFWMTLGIFPAVAITVARDPIRAWLAARSPRLLPVALAAFAALLVLPAAVEAALLLRDTQSVQRRSLAFVHRHFARTVAGFHPENALFCQQEERPFPTYLSQHIYHDFAGKNREQSIERLEARFRAEPVQFILQSWRLNQFPVELRRFWAENYQPYRASVFVAGRRVEGARGEESDVELLVSGRYRWLPLGGPHPLAIDGRLLAPGEIVALEQGAHTVGFVEDVPGGILVLALEEAPAEAPLPFYE